MSTDNLFAIYFPNLCVGLHKKYGNNATEDIDPNYNMFLKA